jgi:hypothetical protein
MSRDRAQRWQAMTPDKVPMANRFSIVLTSSVTGEIARRSTCGRMPAFAEAVRMLRERVAAEASNIRRRCMAR